VHTPFRPQLQCSRNPNANIRPSYQKTILIQLFMTFKLIISNDFFRKASVIQSFKNILGKSRTADNTI